MVAIIIIVALSAVSIGVTSYRYSIEKANEITEKIERPDLIEID